MVLIPKYISLIILLSFASILYANENTSEFENLKVESFSFEKGISHQTVYDIYKDSKGFLWFGTMYGLVHYMGSQVEVYRHNPNDNNSLSNDDVTKIFEDRTGNIWIATFGGGFNKIDLQQNIITRYTSSSLGLENWNDIVWDIKEGKDGNIFIATDNNGILILNPQTGNFRALSISADGSFKRFEKKIYSDNLGNIYVQLPTQGLLKYDFSNKTFTDFSIPDFSLGRVHAVCSDSNNLYISVDNKIVQYELDSQKYSIISDLFPELKNLENVYKLFIDSKNNLWIGSLNKLTAISLSDRKIKTFDASQDNSINRGAVTSIVEDNQGIIWVGSYRGGISKIYQGDNIFTPVYLSKENNNSVIGNDALCMLSIGADSLLIGTDSALVIYDKSDNSFNKILRKYRVNSLVEDNQKNIWAGTDKGLLKLDRNFNVVKSYTFSKTDSNSLSTSYIISLMVDSKNRIWVGTVYGLNLLDPVQNKVTRFVDKLNGQSGIQGNTILSIFEDSEGFIWAGTYSGLNKYDPQTTTFQLFKHDPNNPTTVSNNYVFSFYEDSDYNLWLATGGGLNKFNRENNTFEYFTELDGLGNSVIMGIVKKNNHLFLSTAYGISIFDLQTHSVNTFTKEHGLQGNMFIQRSFSSDEQNIYFGGLNGFTILNLDKYFKNVNDTKILITSVNSIESNISPYTAYEESNKVEFAYDQNYVRFNFTALDFRLPSAIEYKYRLEGFDSTWMNAGDKTFAEYAKIPAGEYKFSVQAKNSNGFFNDQTASINVIVTPPFWQTWWFAFITFLLLGFSIYATYRYNLRRELKRAEEIEEIRNEEEIKLRKKAAEDFHDELGHRITKISLYSELLKRTISDQESGSQTYLKKISDISSNLSTGVKDFIWTLDPANDTLYDVAIRLKDFGDDLFDKSSISFRTSGINESYNDVAMPMDWRRHTILIFKEAMNNILKYSNAKNVLLGFSINGNEIDISLNDDGDGFDVEKIKPGRGLKNIRMRAASVNGKVDIESTKGEGTSIRLHSQLQ